MRYLHRPLLVHLSLPIAVVLSCSDTRLAKKRETAARLEEYRPDSWLPAWLRHARSAEPNIIIHHGKMLTAPLGLCSLSTLQSILSSNSPPFPTQLGYLPRTCPSMHQAGSTILAGRRGQPVRPGSAVDAKRLRFALLGRVFCFVTLSPSPADVSKGDPELEKERRQNSLVLIH